MAANNNSTNTSYTPRTYTSKYSKKINSAVKSLTNWKYDPLKDANYQALAKVYGARGNIAAKDTLGDAAALNGGMQTSYAVSAAQQARNQYNQELAMMIPDLASNAFNMAQTRYNVLRDADDTAYGRFRDTEGDRQWKYTQDYQAARDRVADSQWAQEFALAKKNSSGSGSSGGGRRSSGGSGGGGYVSTSTSTTSMPISEEDFNNIGKKKKGIGGATR